MLQKIKKTRRRSAAENKGSKEEIYLTLFFLSFASSISLSLFLSLSLIIIQHKTEKKCSKKPLLYLSGMNLDDVVDPIPALPCLTGLYEIENSPR